MANYSADDVRDFLVDNRELLNDHLEHYGLPRRSGRYKWGSGKDPYQSTGGKRSFKKAASAGERYIMSKLGSSKRAQKRAAKAREKEENAKAKANKYRDEKAYVKSLSDEELRRINNRDTSAWSCRMSAHGYCLWCFYQLGLLQAQMAHGEMGANPVHDSFRHVLHGTIGKGKCADRQGSHGGQR